MKTFLLLFFIFAQYASLGWTIGALRDHWSNVAPSPAVRTGRGEIIIRYLPREGDGGSGTNHIGNVYVEGGGGSGSSYTAPPGAVSVRPGESAIIQYQLPTDSGRPYPEEKP